MRGSPGSALFTDGSPATQSSSRARPPRPASASPRQSDTAASCPPTPVSNGFRRPACGSCPVFLAGYIEVGISPTTGSTTRRMDSRRPSRRRAGSAVEAAGIGRPDDHLPNCPHTLHSKCTGACPDARPFVRTSKRPSDANRVTGQSLRPDAGGLVPRTATAASRGARQRIDRVPGVAVTAVPGHGPRSQSRDQVRPPVDDVIVVFALGQRAALGDRVDDREWEALAAEKTLVGVGHLVVEGHEHDGRARPSEGRKDNVVAAPAQAALRDMRRVAEASPREGLREARVDVLVDDDSPKGEARIRRRWLPPPPARRRSPPRPPLR